MATTQLPPSQPDGLTIDTTHPAYAEAEMLEVMQGHWVPRFLNEETGEHEDGDLLVVEADQVLRLGDAEEVGSISVRRASKSEQGGHGVVVEFNLDGDNRVTGQFTSEDHLEVRWSDGDVWARMVSPSHGMRRIQSVQGRSVGSISESHELTEDQLRARASQAVAGKQVSERRWTKNGQRGGRNSEIVGHRTSSSADLAEVMGEEHLDQPDAST